MIACVHKLLNKPVTQCLFKRQTNKNSQIPNMDRKKNLFVTRDIARKKKKDEPKTLPPAKVTPPLWI